MFKKIFVVVLFAFALALGLSFAHADENQLMSLMPAQAAPMASGYDCYAYTACPNGGFISCHVWGIASTGTACSWFVLPYRAVGCTGVDAYGDWQSYSFTCQ